MKIRELAICILVPGQAAINFALHFGRITKRIEHFESEGWLHRRAEVLVPERPGGRGGIRNLRISENPATAMCGGKGSADNRPFRTISTRNKSTERHFDILLFARVVMFSNSVPPAFQVFCVDSALSTVHGDVQPMNCQPVDGDIRCFTRKWWRDFRRGPRIRLESAALCVLRGRARPVPDISAGPVFRSGFLSGFGETLDVAGLFPFPSSAASARRTRKPQSPSPCKT